MNKILTIYKILLKTYKNQGWWPLLELHSFKNKGTNPTKTGSVNGYHPDDYSYPKNKLQQLEICIGAILTQNTSWPQVEKALINLNGIKAIDPKVIDDMDIELLKQLIRPAGYFNQKAIYLKEFTEFFLNLKPKDVPTRKQLLEIKGIGDETADSIMLYAFSKPEFVVDAYTKRILLNLNLISEKSSYLEIKTLFESSLAKDYKIYQEYHALIVEHAKHHYSKKPYGKSDTLLKNLNI